MDEELVGAVVKYAPNELRAKLSSTAMARAAANWKAERPADYEAINEHGDSYFHTVDYFRIPQSVGDYGYDTDFELKPTTKQAETRDGVDPDLAESFAEDYVSQVCPVVSEYQEQSMFSEKEFVVAVTDTTERKLADAFGVTVGTVRGKKGRVDEKVEKAKQTQEMMKQVEEAKEPDEEVSIFDGYPGAGSTMDDIVEEFGTELP